MKLFKKYLKKKKLERFKKIMNNHGIYDDINSIIYGYVKDLETIDKKHKKHKKKINKYKYIAFFIPVLPYLD